MATGHEQGTTTRDLAVGTVEDGVPDDGRDRETPVGTDDIGGLDAGSVRPERPERPERTATSDDDDDDVALLPHDEGAGYQFRWQELQTGFVDEPRRTVEQADELVAQVMQRLADSFASERERLEGQWGRGEDVSTEDLRVALQRYRAFFRRLLSA
jgi:hypothetical protein